MKNYAIARVRGREIIDSRGEPHGGGRSPARVRHQRPRRSAERRFDRRI